MKRLVPIMTMMLKVRQRLEAIKERLELTPEQIEKVRPLLMEEAKKLRAVRGAYRRGRPEHPTEDGPRSPRGSECDR